MSGTKMLPTMSVPHLNPARAPWCSSPLTPYSPTSLSLLGPNPRPLGQLGGTVGCPWNMSRLVLSQRSGSHGSGLECPLPHLCSSCSRTPFLISGLNSFYKVPLLPGTLNSSSLVTPCSITQPGLRVLFPTCTDWASPLHRSGVGGGVIHMKLKLSPCRLYYVHL